MCKFDIEKEITKATKNDLKKDSLNRAALISPKAAKNGGIVGIYVLMLDDKLMKIGKAKDGIGKRMSDYYGKKNNSK